MKNPGAFKVQGYSTAPDRSERRVLRIVTQKGLDAAVSRIEDEAKAAPESVRADALYPIGHTHTVNRGQMDIGAFDIGKELASAEQVVTAAKDGKDPRAHFRWWSCRNGMGGMEDSMFGPAYKMSKQAAKRGYIAVAPPGYRIDGDMGAANPGVRS